jgi:hypothetical protein
MFTLSLCVVSINFENKCVFWEILDLRSCADEDELFILVEKMPLIENVIKGFSLILFGPGTSEPATVHFKNIQVLKQYKIVE